MDNKLERKDRFGIEDIQTLRLLDNPLDNLETLSIEKQLDYNSVNYEGNGD